MSTQDYLAEKLSANAHVYLDGGEVKFASLILDQAFGQHHTFRIDMDYESMKQNFMSNPLEEMQLIGKLVNIDLQQGNDSASAYEFSGIISNVSYEGNKGKHGYLVIEGHSTTILLERGKRLDVFCNMDLQKVFDEVTDGIINKSLSSVNKPVYNGQIPFLMQYNESDWEFLQRLSAISGETLFYTGMDLVFGQYKDWAATEVTYDKEIINFKFGAKLLANNFTRYQYLAGQDDTLTQDAPPRIENSDDYLNMAWLRSKDLTEKRPVRKPLTLHVEDKGSLDELVEREKTTTAAQTVYVTGTCKTCAPRIGRLLSILMPDNMPGANELGTYRIVKVRHVIDQNHRYESVFEGIPADLKFYPTPDVKIPVAESLLGLVVKNNDPQGQGRICVEFPFARDRVSDAWMRVMSPNAGSSNEVNKNRGMVFVPEVGDQVMVGFEYGDSNRPFVLGSMYHGNNGEGGGDNNSEKSIITRSGNSITFNDEIGFISIKDKQGSDSTIVLDGNKNISIDSATSITLSTGKSSIQLNENGTINISGAVITINGSTTSTIVSGAASLTATAKGDLADVRGLTTTVHGGDTTTISGQTKTTVTATGQTIIDGAIVKLN